MSNIKIIGHRREKHVNYNVVYFDIDGKEYDYEVTNDIFDRIMNMDRVLRKPGEALHIAKMYHINKPSNVEGAEE